MKVRMMDKNVLEQPFKKTLAEKISGKEEKKQDGVSIQTKKEFKVEDLPGVGAATAEKLREAGFDTLMSIAVASPGEIVETAGVGEAVARKIINVARSKLDMGFEDGVDLLKKREQVIKITTGSKALNALFGGGIETGAITEVYGAYGSGKTSIAHQLAVSVQLPKDKGGASGMAIWVDTEGTLRPEFIEKIAKANNLDSEKALKNFRGSRAFNSDHQMLMVQKIEELIKQGLPVKLVIIDSVMSHFRSEFVGRGTLADRQQKLNKHVHELLKLAHNYNIAVYITNQVMAKPDMFFGDPTEAVGGHVLHHASTYRCYLRRGKKGSRVAKLVDAPAMPDSETIFVITDEGIKDI
ncbi:MAG: DNA repair and recombination protein RadA [Nanoarchaeota archaeon]